MDQTRIDARFAAVAGENRPALITFIMSGDPGYETGLQILKALPAAGADIIELGMPFSDPMADGVAIQLAGQRALRAGMRLGRVLDMVAEFRRDDTETPIVLMGYYNPIYSFGVERFLGAAKDVGVDGLIVVDLPPEEDDELCIPALAAGLNFIRLTTPTTDSKRLQTVLRNTSGFVYYVSMTGVTGAAITGFAAVGEAVGRIKRETDLPVAVGFGIKTPDDAARIGRDADGVVVGSALVSAIGDSLLDGAPTENTVSSACALVRALAEGVSRARA